MAHESDQPEFKSSSAIGHVPHLSESQCPRLPHGDDDTYSEDSGGGLGAIQHATLSHRGAPWAVGEPIKQSASSASEWGRSAVHHHSAGRAL